VIFVVIGSLLVAAIYSSSTFIVFAELHTACSGTGKTTASCTVLDTEDGTSTNWDCTKNKDGKTWSCVKALKTGGSTNIPSALKNAIVKAQAGTTTGDNNTNALNGNAVQGGSTLKNGESR
jgi:hypothetical protein